MRYNETIKEFVPNTIAAPIKYVVCLTRKEYDLKFQYKDGYKFLENVEQLKGIYGATLVLLGDFINRPDIAAIIMSAMRHRFVVVHDEVSSWTKGATP